LHQFFASSLPVWTAPSSVPAPEFSYRIARKYLEFFARFRLTDFD
jgi:hypothetical protein